MTHKDKLEDLESKIPLRSVVHRKYHRRGPSPLFVPLHTAYTNSMGIDPDKELFDSNNDGSGPQPPTSAPPPPPEPEDDDEPRKRTMSEEIEGGSDGQQTLHLSVSFRFAIRTQAR